MSGITRSRLWRLRSITIVKLPSSCVAGSAIASHTLPSSSSASPTSAMNRAEGCAPKWESVYRRVSAEKSGATAPRPTDPVEKSDTSGSFVRDG